MCVVGWKYTEPLWDSRSHGGDLKLCVKTGLFNYYCLKYN